MSIIIGIISQKGGVSKSSLARALACEAVKNGLSTKIADLDIQQATSLNWVRRRLESGIEPEISAEPFKTAKQALKETGKYDLLIIDAPARASEGTYEISKIADLIVQPTGASLDDLEPAILLFHELVRKGIPRDKLVFALSRVGTPAEENSCRDYLSEARYQVLDGCIYEKPAYRQAQNQGLSLTEVSYGSLREKADTLIQSLIDKLS
jgi:chromosome partitioning protein